MRRTVVATLPIAAEATWRRLAEPALVSIWAGVVPLDSPDDYPQPGQRVRWRDPMTGVLLHDEILDVSPGRLLRSRLRTGPALALERYTLRPAGPRATVLRAEWHGHPSLVVDSVDALTRMIRACGARVRSDHGTQSGST